MVMNESSCMSRAFTATLDPSHPAAMSWAFMLDAPMIRSENLDVFSAQ